MAFLIAYIGRSTNPFDQEHGGENFENLYLQTKNGSSSVSKMSGFTNHEHTDLIAV